jgi:hypothetical protein
MVFNPSLVYYRISIYYLHSIISSNFNGGYKMKLTEIQKHIGFFKQEKDYNRNIYRLKKESADGYMFISINGLSIIITYEIHQEKRWIHVSFARKSRMPDYNDIKIIKRDFIGDNKKAIMIFPDEEHYVNLHPYCLHLFCCLDGDGLPEFSREGLL